jgi:uncharacterized protein (TIGR02099 family)
VLWTLFAAIAVFFAVVISIARLMLPEIEQQREAIAQWLSDYIDRPVQIGGVSASWHGWSPSIRVDELVLLNPAGDTELARFDRATIDIALFESIATVSLIPRRLMVSGMEAAFERDADGNIRIAGMPPARWPVAQWILQQRNFTLTDAVVSYTDVTAGKPAIEFSGVTITVTDEQNRQLIQGRLTRRGESTETIEFALRASGDVLGPDWDGDLFVAVSDLGMRSAFSLAGWPAEHIRAGTIRARAWSSWSAAQMSRAVVRVEATDIATVHDDETATIDRVDLAGVVENSADGWWFDCDKMQLNIGRKPGAPGSIALRRRERSGGESLLALRAKNIDLDELRPLLPRIGRHGDARPWPINDVHPSGTLQSVVGGWSDGASPRYYAEANIEKFALRDSAWTPGISGVDFAIRANPHGGVIETAHTAGILVTDANLLAAPIEIQKIAGAINWSRQGEVLRVATDGLAVRAEGIDFVSRGSIEFEPQTSPYLNIVTRINSGSLTAVSGLIPVGKLPPRGDSWVRSAFKSGQFAPSGLLFRGRLADFPFDNGNGSFKAQFEIRDVDLQYSANWPPTTAMSATVGVANRTSTTTVHKGLMYSAELGGSTIEMPDLFTRKPVVRVQGTIRVTADELDRFIEESPLKNTKAVRFQDVDIAGEFGMTMDMSLGIYPGGEKDILGLAQFAGNRIDAPKQKLVLDDVHGDISFTRQDWYGEGLRAVYDGDPVGVVLNGGLDDPNYDTEFRMTGTSAAPQLLKIIRTYAPYLGTLITRGGTHESVGGELPWKVVLSIPEANPNGTAAPRRLTIDSSLVGLELDLPWPFGKSAAEKKPLEILSETTADGQRTIRVNFGSNVNLEFAQTKRADGTFNTQRAEIVFGEEAPAFTGRPGLSASGRIGRLPINEWAAFGRSVADKMTAGKDALPVRFDVHIENLEILGRVYDDADLAGVKSDADWQVSISSPQLQGMITVPRDDPTRPLLLDFERLWLTEKTAAQSTNRVDPRAIPPLELTAASLHFGEIDLGQAEITTSQRADGLKLERLHFAQSGFELEGSGEWVLQGDAHQSRIHLDVEGNTLAGLLARFNYAVANIDGGATEIEINSAWEGTPSEFALEKLQGSFHLRVDEGRFLDIDPGGGRLFGLLSLQTLPRRLSLDFNDLFRKGFSFDRIEGAFELDHGNAYTNSLLMDGPAARIDVSGRTGLADKDYDQRVTVTPALSDSIPVAGAFFGPAGIGVGAVLYLGQKMFKSIPEQVDKFLSREYSITGGWSQPLIERI